MATRLVLAVALVTGVLLELAIGAATGRREAWDSELYWTTGLPIAVVVAAALGASARGRAWFGAACIVPGHVLAMMIRSGEIGTLWPLTLVLSSILGAPFVAVSAGGAWLGKQIGWRSH